MLHVATDSFGYSIFALYLQSAETSIFDPNHVNVGILKNVSETVLIVKLEWFNCLLPLQ